jgi:hypothetical protein
MFGKITRDANDKIISGGDYGVIQTNVSLLNYDARETQNRLLKLERAIFGLDAPTLPGGLDITNRYLYDSVKYKFNNYSLSLTDIGILRIIKELFNKNILIDTLYDPSEPTNSVISNFEDMYLELYGDYSTDTEFNSLIKTDGTAVSINGKFHEVYIWYKKNILYDYEDSIIHIFDENNYLDEVNVNKTLVKPALSSARNIYLYKTHLGYQFESNDKKPFLWPVTNDTSWKGPIPSLRYWSSIIMGLSDEVSSATNDLKNIEYGGMTDQVREINYSFASQSVEGILYDLILKLSYIREKSNQIDESLFSEFTYLSKRYLYSDNTLKLELPYFKDEDKKGIVKDENVIAGGNNLFINDQTAVPRINGEYTGFGFMNEKISTVWSTKILPIYLPENLSNSGNLEQPYFRFISSENITNNLDNLNKWGIYKNKLETASGILKEEYSGDVLPDNVIQYRYNSSGLAFDISGDIGEAEGINTKVHSNLEKSTDNGYTKSFNLITDLGEFVTDVDFNMESTTKSHFYVKQTIRNTGDDRGIIIEPLEILDYDPGSSDGKVEFKTTIDGFKLFGAHIPEEYDMLTKIRAEEHITNQLHLALQDDPYNYPKEINITKADAESILYADDTPTYLVYWKPLNVADNYIVLKRVDGTITDGITGQDVNILGWTLTKINTNAFIFEGSEAEFKIIPNIFNDGDLPYIIFEGEPVYLIPDSDLPLIDGLIIADIEINNNAAQTSDKTLLKANPDFSHLKRIR